jgi:hypothetical protein
VPVRLDGYGAIIIISIYISDIYVVLLR